MRAWVLGALLLAGCAHGHPPDPLTALRAWADALHRDDPQAAYQLLSQRDWDHLSEVDFLATWRATAEERRTQEATVRRALEHPVLPVRAEVELNAQITTLRYEPSGWRLGSTGHTEVGASTPEQAVRSFVQALEDH